MPVTCMAVVVLGWAMPLGRDPAYGYEDNQLISPIDKANLIQEKSKPSFSNAANIAALRAKARLAKKTQGTATDKSDKKEIVKKPL